MSATARRVLSAAQLGIGLVTVARPAQTVGALTPPGAGIPDSRIVRVLGLRQAVQGAIGLARPTIDIISLGVLVDSLHALSLVPLVAFSSRYRASAAASAGLASAAAATGVRLSRD